MFRTIGLLFFLASAPTLAAVEFSDLPEARLVSEAYVEGRALNLNEDGYPLAGEYDVSFLIGVNGTPEDITVHAARGDAALAEPALALFRRWQFQAPDDAHGGMDARFRFTYKIGPQGFLRSQIDTCRDELGSRPSKRRIVFDGTFYTCGVLVEESGYRIWVEAPAWPAGVPSGIRKGSVLLEAQVNKNGFVRGIRVLEPAVNERFDIVAANALKHFYFEPAFGGKLPATLQVPVQLESSAKVSMTYLRTPEVCRGMQKGKVFCFRYNELLKKTSR